VPQAIIDQATVGVGDGNRGIYGPIAAQRCDWPKRSEHTASIATGSPRGSRSSSAPHSLEDPLVPPTATFNALDFSISRKQASAHLHGARHGRGNS
jgi:hypothetical protein